MRARLSGYGYLSLATLTWGSLPVIIARADAPAPVLVGMRMGFGALALGAFLLLFGRRDLIPRRHRGLIALLGVALAVHWTLFFRAIQLIGPTGVVIGFVFPLLVALVAPWVLPEGREGHVLPLAGLGLLGTVLIVVSEAAREGEAGLGGGLIALASAVLAAFLVIGARRVIDDVPGPVIAFWQEAIGVVLLVPWMLLSPPVADIPWAWGALLGVVHTALAAVLFFRAIGRVPAQEVGVLMYVEPAAAVLITWGIDGVQPTVADGIGGALILGAGVALVAISSRRPVVAAEGVVAG